MLCDTAAAEREETGFWVSHYESVTVRGSTFYQVLPLLYLDRIKKKKKREKNSWTHLTF